MKKITLMATMLLLLCGLTAMVSAQEDFNIPVGAGTVSTVDLGETTDVAHDTIGGVVSSIALVENKDVTFLGTRVFREVVSNNPSSFQLLAIRHSFDCAPDLNTVNPEAVYQVSESNVNIRGAVGTWTTNNAEVACPTKVSDGSSWPEGTNAFSFITNSIDGQALQLLPAQSYDLYAIIN